MTKFSNSNFKRLEERNEALSKMRSKYFMPSVAHKKNSLDLNSEYSTVSSNRYTVSSRVKFQDGSLETLSQNGKFIVESNNNETWNERYASQAYLELAALTLKARDEKGIYLSLSWPVGIEWISLSQAIACIENSFNSDNSCRVATYPTVQSGYSRLNKTRFPMQRFLAEGRKAANTGQALSLRELVYLHLNQLEHDDDPRKNPAIPNSLSIFEWNNNISNWEYYGKGYFSDVSVALHHHKGNTQGQKDQVKELSLFMADPSKTKEALFRVGRGVKHEDVKQILFNIGNQFDVITIDARKKLLNSINSWRSLLKEIMAYSAYEDKTPSLMLLTDNTDVYEFFINTYWELLKNKEQRDIKPLNHLNILKQQREPWVKEDDNYSGFQSNMDLNVEITDTSSLFKIRELIDIARNESDSNPKFARELFKSIGFLRRILNLPVGQDIINTWLRSKSDSHTDSQLLQTASRYSWTNHSLQLYSQTQNDESYDEVVYKKFFTICEKLLEQNNGSCIDKTLISIISNFQNKGKKIFILVDEYPYVELLYSLLRSSFSNEIIDNIKISDSSKLISQSNYDHLIIAGGKINRIQKIILCKTLPNTVTLILDAYSFLLIKRNLLTLRAFEEYERLHNRIDHVISIISPKIKSIEQIGDDLTLPIEISITGSFYNTPFDAGSCYAVINFSGFESRAVGEGTTLIKKSLSTTDKKSFLAVTVSDLAEGDEIVNLGESLRNQMNEVIKSQAGQLTKSAESLLVSYFELAAKNIKTHYNFNKRSDRSRAILNKMVLLDESIAKSTNEISVNRWIKHIEDSYTGAINQNHEPISTNSPKDERVFLLFAQALYIQKSVAKIFWDEGIRKLRIAHILEGRKFGQNLKKILTGSISQQDMGFDDSQMALIYEIADQNSYPVEMIIYKNEDVLLENKTNSADKDL